MTHYIDIAVHYYVLSELTLLCLSSEGGRMLSGFVKIETYSVKSYIKSSNFAFEKKLGKLPHLEEVKRT